MLGPFKRAPRRSPVSGRQIEEWSGRVRNGRNDPCALLVCSGVDQTVCRRAGQRLLQLVAIEFEQLRNALRLSGCRDLKQAFEQRPAGLPEEVIRPAFVAARRFGNERSRERRRVSLVVSLAQFQPRRPVGTAFIDRVQDQVSAHGPVEFGDVFALRIDHDRELAARLDLAKERTDRHRLPRPGRSRDEEMLALGRARNANLGELDSRPFAPQSGAAKFSGEPARRDQREASQMLPL